MWGLMLVAFVVTTFVLWRRIDELEARLADAGVFGRFEPGPAARHAPPPVDWPAWDDAVPPSEASPAPPPPVAEAPRPAVAMPDPAPVEDMPIEQPAGRPRLGFEDIFGRYLPIWAGGITLAVAGFLIVKFSIDAGLLSPAVRVIAGLLFGTTLIAGAEAALRRDDWVRDARIRQALSGAGIATLYASILVAANLYDLIDPMLAFVGLAGVTVLAGLLSLRFGAPSAVLGLVGGLAAPALVGTTDSSVPLLSVYLAMTVAGLSLLGRAQRWWWLGSLAMLGGLGWGAVLIVGAVHDVASVLSVGGLTLILSVGLPLLVFGEAGKVFRLVAAILGCAQIASIVALGDFAPIEWGLFALLSVALIWLSRREALLADAPLGGLATGVLLMLTWPRPDATFGLVLAGGALIYGMPALWRVWRAGARPSDAVQLTVIASAVALVPIAQFAWTMPRADFAPLALIGTAIAGTAAALGWRHAGRSEDARFALLSLTAILLGLLGAGLVLPVWALAPAIAGAAVVALALGLVADDRRIDTAAGVIACISIAFLGGYDPQEILRSYALSPSIAIGPSFARWALVAAVMLAFAWRAREPIVRQIAGAVTPVLLHVAFAQIVPAEWVALVPVAMIVALALAGSRAPIAAIATAGAISAAWAVYPLAVWLVAGGQSAVGLPFYATTLPALDTVAIRIVAPLLALALVLWRRPLPQMVRHIGIALIATLAVIVAHIVWKQVFAIADWQRFVALGMAERTLWEAILLAAALAAWRLGARPVGAALGIAGLLHFGWYTLLMHNPLWSEQAAGIWLVPAYGIGFAALWLSRHPLPGAAAERARDIGRMVLILLLAPSLLRQAFHGTMLAEGGVLPAEDIGRSLLAIGLAIAFLQWGIRRRSRDWRIASLALMLGAVGKVFLFDAAGLDGLMRIASFAALGFSLIGVGWLYSRYLPDARGAALTDESLPSDTNQVGIQG